MRPMQKLMKRLVNAEPGEDTDRVLLKIGDHIFQWLRDNKAKSEKKELEQWHRRVTRYHSSFPLRLLLPIIYDYSYLWIFMARFTSFTHDELFDSYKQALEKRAAAASAKEYDVAASTSAFPATTIQKSKVKKHYYDHHHHQQYNRSTPIAESKPLNVSAVDAAKHL